MTWRDQPKMAAAVSTHRNAEQLKEAWDTHRGSRRVSVTPEQLFSDGRRGVQGLGIQAARTRFVPGKPWGSRDWEQGGVQQPGAQADPVSGVLPSSKITLILSNSRLCKTSLTVRKPSHFLSYMTAYALSSSQGRCLVILGSSFLSNRCA